MSTQQQVYSPSDILLFDTLPIEVRTVYRGCHYDIPAKFLLDFAAAHRLPLLSAFRQIELAVARWSMREWPREAAEQ